ncbi:MAG: thioredoxin family protein [Chloroflexota bacterium]|nr:thioredoxin family protein [Chloroflexota bacterium]
MPLLQDQHRQQLRDYLARNLQDPVRVHLFTQRASLVATPVPPCPTCQETEDLLKEVSGLSDKVLLEVHDLVTEAQEARRLGVDRVPALVYQGKNKGVLRYFGLPAGHEIAVLVEDLGDLSRGTTRLSAPTRQSLAGLTRLAHIKVLVLST